MSKYTYRLAVQDARGEWVTTFVGMSLAEGRGYLWCHRDTPAPREALRLVRSDGRIMEESAADATVSIGAGVGFPCAGDYARAALRALERARWLVEGVDRDTVEAAIAQVEPLVGLGKGE